MHNINHMDSPQFTTGCLRITIVSIENLDTFQTQIREKYQKPIAISIHHNSQVLLTWTL